MNNKQTIKPTSSKHTTCATGGCGSTGMCPGIALAICYGIWALIFIVSDLIWLAWALTVPVFLLLVTGSWRRMIDASSAFENKQDAKL